MTTTLIFFRKDFYKLAAAVLCCLVPLSCDRMLEVKIPANQISSELVFENVQTADAALAGLYANLRDSGPVSGGAGGSGIMWGMYTDDLDSYSTSGENREIWLNVHTANNSAVLSFWTASYRSIFLANSIIEGVTKSQALSETDRARIKGEALTVRSLMYFYLMHIYGDVPYAVSTDYTINQALRKTKLTDMEVILENDVKEAVSLLQDPYRNAERIFPNKKAAQLLLAKIYMQQQKWGMAENVLTEILGSPLYTFEQDVSKVFQKSGSHIFWQLKPKNANDPTKEIQVLYFSGAAPTLYALSPGLISSFTASDKRLHQWTAAVTAGPNTWYRADKYKNRTNNANEYSIVFRLEEAYLFLAEALAQQNKVPQALPYVNATRLRAQLPAVAVPITKEVVLNEILLENRKEFFVEMGHRFLDLKRAGRLNDLKNTKLNWKDEFRLWPVPQKEILLNPNLKPQNNGY